MPPTKRPLGSPREQRAALLAALRRLFPIVHMEWSDANWLLIEGVTSGEPELSPIYDALCAYRGFDCFHKSARKLKCDFHVPACRLILEYDERQHFTIPRAISLRHYPKNAKVAFDVDRWIGLCEQIRCVDKAPPFRDEQRAYYDSARDLKGGENGFKMLRLKHGDFDWRVRHAAQELEKLLNL